MISHNEKNGKLYFKYNDELLAVVRKSVLSKFLEGDKPKAPKKEEGLAKRRKPSVRSIRSLIQNYTKAKENFYGKRLPQTITENSKEYKYFKEADKLAYELEVNSKQYIKAQVAGLGFVNNGRGQFPKPSQLVGQNAIDRVLDYIRQVEVSEDEIELSNIDTWKPLEENTKYQAVLKKINNQKATLSEAYYAKKVQKHWNGKASMDVEVYIEIMEEDVSK